MPAPFQVEPLTLSVEPCTLVNCRPTRRRCGSRESGEGSPQRSVYRGPRPNGRSLPRTRPRSPARYGPCKSGCLRRPSYHCKHVPKVSGGLRLSGLLRSLSPRQEKVVRLYFGLGCEPQSASEMAQEFGVSSHVISGILGGAKRRLAQVGLTPTRLKEAARYEAELRQPMLSRVFAGSKKKCSARNSRS